ncbi:phage protein Gp37 [Aquitalea pelogenes]|uniref:phage protein Gp37 n=1 Tax=Aquitalea pelogenes TaxID=1293573 RepID=UPI00078875DF
MFACEFACSWLEQALPPGHWPTPPAADEDGAIDARDPDAVFSLAHGQTGAADPPLLGIGLNYHLSPDDGQADAQDMLRSTS